VALHNRLEPLAGLTHRIVHALTDLLLNVAQLRPHAFADRATLAGVYAAAGKTQEARRVLAQLTQLSKKRYVCPYEMATAYATLGDRDEAIRWLEKGVDVRSICMPDLKTDPRLDSLRSDSRFQRIARLVGLPQ
jgi:tetratricopeptide (TPR) repeat protein